jgi:hypothetical protein
MTNTPELKFGLVEALLSVLCIISTAGIPWAYSIHGQLVGIESALKYQAEKVEKLEMTLSKENNKDWHREQMRLWVEKTQRENPNWKGADPDDIPF